MQVLKIELTMEQNKLVRKMLEEQIEAYKNWIVSAVETGADEYGSTGTSGFTHARKLCRELEAHRELTGKFIPTHMFARCATEI